MPTGDSAATAPDGPAAQDAYRPALLRRDDAQQRAAIDALRSVGRVMVHDTIALQLADLLRTRHPQRKLPKDELAAHVARHVGGTPLDDYGVWVHYPWSRRLVHLLDEAEFVELRTDRNRLKIAGPEQEQLRARRVGVVGLSVGQSVALALALERSCGELRLADFDTLDLSNLNRIRAGVHDLGVPKTHVTAREIAEIDPFLAVRCFDEGLCADTWEAFFHGGGDLDCVVDECDSLDVKLRLRAHARARRIPVVMDTSDRGMLDIERFDLEPDRPILHGLVDGLDPARVAGLTNEEKVPHVLRILGEETLSQRMRASLVEVEQSLSTWPQLASAVACGGGVAADVVRRILLGSVRQSGRFFVDLDELIPGEDPAEADGEAGADGDADTTLPPRPSVEEREPGRPPLDTAGMMRAAAEARVDAPGAPLPDRTFLERRVADGIQAPSGGNSQPWRWLATGGRLHLFHDHARSAALCDYRSLGAIAALGAAAENVVLGAGAEGWEASVDVIPSREEPRLVASFAFRPSRAAAPDAALARAVGVRCTDRARGPRLALEPLELETLRLAAEHVPGARLSFLVEPEAIARAGGLAGAGDRIRILDRDLNVEMMRELRFTDEEARATRDGLAVSTLGLTALELAGMRACRHLPALSIVRRWGSGRGLEKLSVSSFASAGAVGLLTVAGSGAADYFQGGRAMQRAWLAATAAHLALHPMTTLPYLLARLERAGGEGLAPASIRALAALRAPYRALLPVRDGEAEVLLFRVSRALSPPERRALRRPVADVLDVME